MAASSLVSAKQGVGAGGANVIVFPNSDPAVLYARMMACKFALASEAERREAYTEKLEWVETRMKSSLSLAGVREMISRRRRALLAELELLDEL